MNITSKSDYAVKDLSYYIIKKVNESPELTAKVR